LVLSDDQRHRVIGLLHSPGVSAFVGDNEVDLAAVQVGVVAVGSWAVLPFTAESVPAPSPALLGSVAYLGSVSCALAMTVQTWGQRRVSPTRAATLFAGEPVFATLFGVWLLGDVFGVLDVAGALLVMAAVACTLVAGRPRVGTAVAAGRFWRV